MPSAMRHHADRPASLARLLTASMSALLLVGLVSVSMPAEVLGSTPVVAACAAVNLRTGTSTGYALRTSIRAGTTVTAVARVSGGSWKTPCAGKTVSGSRWYRISQIKGKSVRSLYGVNYLYGAAGLFKTVASPSTAATGAVSRTRQIEGIDVSVWQGTIDWAKVAAAGKRFAIIRASAGSLTVDVAYARNRARAKAAGLYVGAYHAANPDKATHDALREANLFLSVAKSAKGDIVPALDLEVSNGLSTTALRRWVTTWLARVTAVTGIKPMIYTTPSFWNTHMGDMAFLADRGYTILWMAHWGVSRPTVPAQKGTVTWTFWQYSSDGSVPGIRGRVDLDRFRGTDLARVLVR